jgi:ubiquinone/menaquinone biosynthesis C-methylase UbiE
MTQDFSDLHRFENVDATAEAGRFVEFLEWTDSRPDVGVRRRRSYELLRVEPGARIADVGSGLGTVVRELAELGAEPVGVDASAEMVEQARRRVPGGDFRVADAAALPFDDGELDGYRAERVYQHVRDPAAALAEARRVLVPGGRIVLVDQDWDALVVDGNDRRVTRAIVLAYADSMVDGWAGRRARRHLLDAGFENVAVEIDAVTITDYDYVEPLIGPLADTAVSAGVVTRAEADAWAEDQRRRGAEGRTFAAMSHVIASAENPAV